MGWVNAMMFYQAWKDMREKQLTTGSDWVVKVDADTVFLPERLLTRLQGYHVPAGGVYLETCKAALDWKGTQWKFGPWGEDLFMQQCLDKNGVSKQSDFTMDADGMCKENWGNFRPLGGMHVPYCKNSKQIVFHPFMKPADYFQCLAETQDLA